MDFGYVVQRKAGRYFERQTFSRNMSFPTVRMLPHEIDKSTGEVVKPYIQLKTGKIKLCRTNNQSLNIESVRKRCKVAKWLIRANEKYARLFVTLTYKENMCDTKRLYQDFKKFWMRLSYAYPSLIGYMVAFEPQERGAWHAHILLLSKRNSIYISNSKIQSLWGFGFTKTKKCSKVALLAEYVTSYLTNVKDGEQTKKGKRLGFYPRGFQFFRTSRNLLKPLVSSFIGNPTEKIPNLFNMCLIYDYVNERFFEHFKLITRNFLWVSLPS